MKKKTNKKQEVFEQDYGKSGGKQDFLNELFAFQKKYPECYIEAWTPEDYTTQTEKPLTLGQCQIVSSNLYDYADANEGTTWDKIKYMVNKTLQEYED